MLTATRRGRRRRASWRLRPRRRIARCRWRSLLAELDVSRSPPSPAPPVSIRPGCAAAADRAFGIRAHARSRPTGLPPINRYLPMRQAALLVRRVDPLQAGDETVRHGVRRRRRDGICQARNRRSSSAGAPAPRVRSSWPGGCSSRRRQLAAEERRKLQSPAAPATAAVRRRASPYVLASRRQRCLRPARQQPPGRRERRSRSSGQEPCRTGARRGHGRD